MKMKVLHVVFCLHFCFIGTILSSNIIKNNANLQKPRILILGPTGSGKSSLADALIGEDPTSDESTFPVCHGIYGCTKNTSYCSDHTWLGEKTNPLFTVVDTPGFGGDSDVDMDDLFDEMTEVLHDDIKAVDVVLLTIPGDTTRFPSALIDMLKQLEMLYGRKMWNSTMIEISMFPYAQDDIRHRNETCEMFPQNCHDETFFYYEINEIINREFDLEFMLPICFIDSYAKKPSNIDDETQQQHFLEESDKLWEFAKNSLEFRFQTVDEVLKQNENLKKEIEILEMVIENNCSQPHGAARLVGGNTNYEGRVEIFLDGSWVTVCDDSWDTLDGTVVCRMLGYGPATSAPGNAFFGEGNGKIAFDDVNCVGTETDIFQCFYNDLPNCQHGEDAGVVCSND